MPTVSLPSLKVACKACVALQAIKKERARDWEIYAAQKNADRAFFRKWLLMFWLRPLSLNEIMERERSDYTSAHGMFTDDYAAWHDTPDSHYAYEEKRIRQILFLTRLGAPFIRLTADDMELLGEWQ